MKFLFIFFLVIIFYNKGNSNNIALPCYGCHGFEGYNAEGSIPSIAGLKQSYFIEAFKEYKNKERKNYLMQIISKGYTDIQIKSLAVFFESTGANNDK